MARRHWEFDLADGHHVVDLVHGYFLGTRSFVVDGAKTVQRTIPFTNHSGEHPFPFPGHEARVRITTNGLMYDYDLVVDGNAVAPDGRAGTVVRPRLGGPGSLRLAGTIALLIGVPFAAFVLWGDYDEFRFHTASATAVGIVQDKRVQSSRYGPTYQVTYTFTDPTGRTHTNSGDVPRASYEQARPGSRYTIQFLTADPNRSRVLGKDETLSLAFLTSMAALCVGYGLYAFVNGSRRLAVLKRVGEIGQAANATVTKLKKGSIKGVGNTVTIEYEYDDPFGRKRKGRGPLMYPAEAARFSVGGPLRVLVDPDRPGDSVLP